MESDRPVIVSSDTERGIHPRIQEMAHRIAKRFTPDRIILFGSHARGTAGPDSDADLLVVMPDGGSRRKQATAIDLALIGIDFPADVIVVTPQDLERSRHRKDSIIYPAIREGIVLYERPS